MDTRSTGQWDGRSTWAPLVWLAVQGLRRYGYHDEANRVAAKFVRNVTDEFGRSGKLLEKYHAEGRTSEVTASVTHGYKSNENGFGWTNVVVVDLWATLPQRWRNHVVSD